MRNPLFTLTTSDQSSLQTQVRELMVNAILNQQLPSDEPLPSSRRLAKTLGVSRNTVVLAYQRLVDDGYLIARERSGYFVNRDILEKRPETVHQLQQDTDGDAVNWMRRLQVQPSLQENLRKPKDWQNFTYPFIYGQVDHGLFPMADWRECSRQALGRRWLEAWTDDARADDDPMLVEQVRTRILPRRGIMASNDEILITLGAQNALYLLSRLFIAEGTTVGMEDPGYPDIRNIFRLRTDRLQPLPLDDGGMQMTPELDNCDVVYVTPSHQFPTTVTMPIERRVHLLERAVDRDFLIIEDDYEFETNYLSAPCPALKSLDRNDRVLYVGSFSKTLFPGLRLGFLVAPAPIIREARALRRLMVRHPPSNNQRTAALFLSLGHHDALIHRLHRAYHARWQAMAEALERHLPASSTVPSFGGTSFWVRGADGLDAEALAETALEHSMIIEPGRIYFAGIDAPRNYFRLGFSSIDSTRIEPGIRLLADLIDQAG